VIELATKVTKYTKSSVGTQVT